MGSSPIVNKSAVAHSASAGVGLDFLDRSGAPLVRLLLCSASMLMTYVAATITSLGH